MTGSTDFIMGVWASAGLNGSNITNCFSNSSTLVLETLSLYINLITALSQGNKIEYQTSNEQSIGYDTQWQTALACMENNTAFDEFLQAIGTSNFTALLLTMQSLYEAYPGKAVAMLNPIHQLLSDSNYYSAGVDFGNMMANIQDFSSITPNDESDAEDALALINGAFLNFGLSYNDATCLTNNTAILPDIAQFLNTVIAAANPMSDQMGSNPNLNQDTMNAIAQFNQSLVSQANITIDQYLTQLDTCLEACNLDSSLGVTNISDIATGIVAMYNNPGVLGSLLTPVYQQTQQAPLNLISVGQQLGQLVSVAIAQAQNTIPS